MRLRSFSTFFPHRRQSTFDDFITATRELADEARFICRLAGKRLGWRKRQAQHSFVDLLLEAAADANSKLTLNVRSERGPLVDAIKLLLPYLPHEISKMPSFSTLKNLRRAWGKNRGKNFKKRSI
jgi:hypothetical protein